jgi:predicted Rdx family selenoprotein
VALIPATGGTFTVTVTHSRTSVGGDAPSASESAGTATTDVGTSAVDTVVWDRKAEGGFPETKELKSRVRNIIEPGRDLGHIDRSLKKTAETKEETETRKGLDVSTQGSTSRDQQTGGVDEEKDTKDCEDCK